MGSSPTLSPAARPAAHARRTRQLGVGLGGQRVARPPPDWRLLGLILAAAAVVRVWQLNDIGFNSDEAVYAGQAAAIADRPELDEFFPVFRAHPLLFQTVLSLGFQLDLPTASSGSPPPPSGVATVYLVYELGRLLYGRKAGLLAALLMALMPYHVVVTRQVLLDGPMTLFATLTLRPAGSLRAQRPAGLAVRRRRRDGPDLPLEGDQHRPARRRSTPSWR